LRYETFDAGEIVIKQGAAADRFFIVVEGEVDVLEERDAGVRPVSVLGPGESFGEGALLLNTTRTATVRARTPLRVLSLDRHTFQQVLLLITEADAE
jgi:CRP-like cAMP-binding protein